MQEYPEAIRQLATKYSIEIQEDKTEDTEEVRKAKSKKDSLYIVLNFAKTFYESCHYRCVIMASQSDIVSYFIYHLNWYILSNFAQLVFKMNYQAYLWLALVMMSINYKKVNL